MVFPLAFLGVIYSCHLIDFKLFAKPGATLTFLKRERNSDHHRMKKKKSFPHCRQVFFFTVDPFRTFSFEFLVFLLRYITLVMNTVDTNSYSREHTEIACVCTAVIAIGTAHTALF